MIPLMLNTCWPPIVARVREQAWYSVDPTAFERRLEPVILQFVEGRKAQVKVRAPEAVEVSEFVFDATRGVPRSANFSKLFVEMRAVVQVGEPVEDSLTMHIGSAVHEQAALFDDRHRRCAHSKRGRPRK